MIKTFGDKRTENIWKGIPSKRTPARDIQKIVLRKLQMITRPRAKRT